MKKGKSYYLLITLHSEAVLLNFGIISTFWLLSIKLLWIFVYKSLCGYTFSFLTPRRKIIGSHSKSVSKFLRNAKTFRKLLYNFTLLPATYESFHCSTSSPTLTVVSFFNFIHSSGCAIVSHYGFNLHFADFWWR